MIKKRFLTISLLAAFPWIASAQDAKTVLRVGAKTMGIDDLNAVGSFSYFGAGASFKFGDAKSLNTAWPKSTVTKYTRVVDFDTGGSLEEITRPAEPESGSREPQVETRRIPFVEPYGLVGKQYDIWMTPIGFLKRALAADSTAKSLTVGGKQFTTVSFVADKRYTITGYFNGQNFLERVETRVDNPVLGDMLVESIFSDYKDLNHGLIFPTRIVQKEGGFPVLDLTITDAIRNAVKYVGELMYSQVNGGAPEYHGPFLGKAPPIFVDQLLYGDRVYDFAVKDQNEEVHHSVLMEFNDYLVVIEAPLDEDHASAVITEIRKIFGNKPIRYVVDTNPHFDALGGLRTYAAEGATILTQESNRGYLEKVLALPRTVHPDKFAQSKKKLVIEAVGEKRILTDGTHVIELHHVQNSDVDGMLMAFLPKEKLVLEAELFIVRKARVDVDTDGHAVTLPNPPDTRYASDLIGSLDRLKIDYKTVLCLVGRAAPKTEVLEDIKNPGGAKSQTSTASIPQ